MDNKQLDDLAVQTFRRYLRIRSDHPNPDYVSCVEFLLEQAKLIGLECNVIELVPGKPIVVMRWEGTDPKLSAVMLNSHMDVVPAREDLWEHDPFSAELDEEGRVFGRGSQDMKHLAIMHMEAVHRLKAQGVRLRRTVVITMVPDEEIGGADGMEKFTQSEDFRRLNVGLELDESMPWMEDELIVFHCERSVWRPRVTCRGFTGHGARLTPGTPGEKLRVVLDRFMDYRQEQLDTLQRDPGLWMGDVTSVNLTMVEGGMQANVIPPEMSAVFDMRLNPHIDFDEMERRMRQWCSEAGDQVELEFLQKEARQQVTDLGPDNVWWAAFQRAADKLKLKIRAVSCPGTTDARFLRNVGVPALGFSAINLTPPLLHGHNEFIRVSTLLQGIRIFQELLLELANVQ
ncbi:aminoacylase-1-like [Schistocerca nitens]|uniref:aminoacylase-1-like n=1 Tax=Schistocerca nitens TaxID=7011 RepID=UPI002117FFFF|nr:aminoacylase-1-like [Schistocerca nitens]